MLADSGCRRISHKIAVTIDLL